MEWKGAVVLLTGASRGIGATIAPTLAEKGARLALVARDAAALEKTRAVCLAKGATAMVFAGDISSATDLERIVREVEAALGPVDILVNNAGLESVVAFETIDPDEMRKVIDVNLVGPMLLTRLVLPGMLARKRGHIVNVASLAGLSAAAYNETYVATKHGIVGFTRSLRATFRNAGSAVSASAVCPGFIRDAGMFADQIADHGVSAPSFMGTSTPQQVADGVVRAVERDVPELVVNPGPIKPLIAIVLMFPRFGEWLANALGTHEATRKAAGR